MSPAVPTASAIASENEESVEVLQGMIGALILAPTPEDVNKESSTLASFINGPIEDRDAPTQIFELLVTQLANKKNDVARERALEGIAAIARHKTVSATVEPYLVSFLPQILSAASDKKPSVRVAAENAALAIAFAVNPNAVKAVLPPVLKSLKESLKWQEKVLDLKFIESLCTTSKVQTSYRVPDLIPRVSDAMWDTKKEIKEAALKCIQKVCALISNKDIERFIPELIKCIAKPENVPETVHLLGATTFVTDVHEPTLAIMVPLLERGLADRETAIKRKSAVIVDNMCKLVEDPQIVAAFLPLLMPALKKNADTLADPEACEKTKQALNTLSRVGNVKDGKIPEISKASDVDTLRGLLLETFTAKDKAYADQKKYLPILNFACAIAGQLVDEKETSSSYWVQITPYIASLIDPVTAKGVVDTLRLKASPGAIADDAVLSDEEEGEDLCNCTFNLAYGAKILLNQTHLRLKRGQRYGILGPNGSGKTTLMRAINNEQVEGFPKQSEVKTVFVEHDLDSDDADIGVLDWTMMKLEKVKITTSKDEVKAKLLEFGFVDEQIDNPIGSLSGGWKMKLALARAVFESPDILLLDEPTNHMDVVNVAWLEQYLINTPCTSLIISHDSKFLDNVIQHVIHYERFKLKRYRGNLTSFIAKVPSARSYKDIRLSEMEFKFPEPGFLENVKTKAKAIVRARNVQWTWPNKSKPLFENVTFQVSLGSRIAIIGPNGAGKSTLVNLLTGEMVLPDLWGEIYTHENIRIAYIKQHAFSHIEKFLHLTPSEYIQWRFQTGEDRETMDRANKISTESDENAKLHIYIIENTKRRVIGIHSRRKFKNSYEYECSFALGENVGTKSEKWTPMMTADNTWLPRNEIIATHSKMVAEVDQKEALASGRFRPLVRKEIEAHCANFGIDAEIVSHSRMQGLSGGQRVKVVLAACTWQRPHVIVLDEPTNYLDRDSLGALSNALKAFEGGVIIISHAKEFTESLTNEVWAVNEGKMVPSGHNWVQGQGTGTRLKGKDDDEEETFDAMGNKIDATKKKAKFTSSELRKKKKERMARRKRGEEVYSDEDE